MRPLEVSLIVAGLPVALWYAISARRPAWWAHVVTSIAVILGVLQVLVEGYRWQMLPAYAGVCGVLLLDLARFRRAGRPARLVAWPILACFSAALLLGIVYPVFRLPVPDGPYRIGTASYHLIDQNRAEPFSPKPGARREVMMQVWYPADPGAAGKAELYRSRAETTWESSYLTLVRTHALAGVAVAKAQPRYPVVIFDPSWHGVSNQSLFQVEELASHGFIVAGVDHPYSSGVTVFPDGRVIRARPAKFLDTSSEETLRETDRIAEEEVQLRAADLRFVLDSLVKLNEKDGQGFLTGRMDLNRTGILGYSFGGAVAAQACWMDHRFKAALDLDGMLFGESAREGIEQPFLVMSDSSGPPSAAELASPRLPRRRWAEIVAKQVEMIGRDLTNHGGYTVDIRGVSHGNFSDDALFSPLGRLAGGGSINNRRAMTIINAYTLAFFEEYLNGRPEPLLDEAARRYPEVSVAAFGAARHCRSCAWEFH